MNIPFSPPDITEEEIEAVAEVMRSGWITTGPKTKELERKMAEFTHTNRGVCLNSATSCMEMALRLFEIGPGDEVIVPAYTYTASASVVCHVGATLRLVDVEKGTFHIDYAAVESMINENTRQSYLLIWAVLWLITTVYELLLNQRRVFLDLLQRCRKHWDIF